MMEARAAMVEEGGQIDWGCGEALAFGSLVLEGIAVRVSGQDTGRGTFSHRHAVLHDVENAATYVPLDHIRAEQARFDIIDSMLSENACLGFEFGFSMADPSKLVVWEAQFGDFANGAQVIIDQFIASSESKWQRMSGLVLLLPHGYEGQGPEHSSARLERFLQLCAEHNMQVCNFTTPAQYFHALRRQMHRSFRKPLVVMSPKSLLRHRGAVSTLRDLTAGRFQPVLDDVARPARYRARRPSTRSACAACCCAAGRSTTRCSPAGTSATSTPSPSCASSSSIPSRAASWRPSSVAIPNAERVCWVQEEPANMGAWRFVEPLLRPLLGARTLAYVGPRRGGQPRDRVVQDAPGRGSRPGEPRLRAPVAARGKGDMFEVRIPSLGESVTEAEIARWAKADGDTVKQDEVLLELESDKASMELPAERSGVLRIVKQAGETVAVGDLVARIEDGPGATAARRAAGEGAGTCDRARAIPAARARSGAAACRGDAASRHRPRAGRSVRSARRCAT